MPAIMSFPGGSAVDTVPAMQESRETQIRSLGGEDPLEKGVATHSSILTWRMPWTEEPVGYSPWGCKETRLKRLSTHVSCNHFQVPGNNQRCGTDLSLCLGGRRSPRRGASVAN